MAETKPRPRRRTAPRKPPAKLAQPKPAPPAGTAPQPAPAGEPEPRRVCAFCHTPQPLSQLSQVATWLECADREACASRAASSGLYPQVESEQALAAFQLAQGAIR